MLVLETTHIIELHHLFNSVKGKEMQETDIQAVGSVSYTHLTLPTNREV